MTTFAASRDFWNNRSVFLTGHTGFKGGWLALWLQTMGARVYGYSLAPDTNPNLFTEAQVANGMTSEFGDIRDLKHMTEALRRAGPSIVLHLAAQPLVRESYRTPIATFETNVIGTANLLEAVKTVGGVEATVIVTTDKCYENREHIYSYREHDALGGHDPYSGSKACSEIITGVYARSYFHTGEHGAIASGRAGNVLGGGDWSGERLVPDIARALSQGKKVSIRRPDAVRPWQHVLEPLWGYLRLAEVMAATPTRFETFNFGPNVDAERKVLDLAKRLCDRWGSPDALSVEPDGGPHEATLLTLDNTKARHLLDWTPRLSFDDTLDWVADWYKAYYAGGDARAWILKQIADYENRLTV